MFKYVLADVHDFCKRPRFFLSGSVVCVIAMLKIIPQDYSKMQAHAQ